MTAPTFVHLYHCKPLEILQQWRRTTVKVDYTTKNCLLDVCPPFSLQRLEMLKAPTAMKVDNCQSTHETAKLGNHAAASNSFRVLGPPYWSAYCSAFLPSKREIVGFDDCTNAEDVLARSMLFFCCCCKATRTECLRGVVLLWLCTVSRTLTHGDTDSTRHPRKLVEIVFRTRTRTGSRT